MPKPAPGPLSRTGYKQVCFNFLLTTKTQGELNLYLDLTGKNEKKHNSFKKLRFYSFEKFKRFYSQLYNIFYSF